jgi:polyhydroxybutyrate depolymerase
MSWHSFVNDVMAPHSQGADAWLATRRRRSIRSHGFHGSDIQPDMGSMRSSLLRDSVVALLCLGSAACGSDKSTGNVPDTGVVAGSGCGATVLPKACDTYKTGPCRLTVGQKVREYFVVPPANYDANLPTPVVFVWHYMNGTAQTVSANGFYGVRAGLPNAIYVAGQGLPSESADDAFESGWPNTDDQDVAFTKAMLTWLGSNYCVDPARIFSTGMSFGGYMSNTLGCEMPDIFRAIGVMSGGFVAENGSGCVAHPIAAWFTHGDSDTTVPIAEDVVARDLYLSNNGCSTTETQTVVLNSDTTCTVYSACSAGNYPVVWCPVVGGGHVTQPWAGAEIAKFFASF